MRTIALRTLVLLVCTLSGAGSAAASYPGANGVIAWQQNNFNLDAAQGSTSVVTTSATLARCEGTVESTACAFGRPSYSPDGQTVLVSRLVPGDPTGDNGPGVLMLIGADGSGARVLPAQTVDDEQPAFMPSATQIVFAGRNSPHGLRNLFTVGVDGTGRRQLTTSGGSWPAPCANGTVAFDRGADIFLLSRDHRHQHRIVRNASQPDCAPNGRSIVFLQQGHLASAGIDGRHRRQLRRDRSDSSPSYAPNGHAIAYFRYYNVPSEDGSRSELDVCNLAGRVLSTRDVADEISGTYGEQTDQGGAGGASWQPLPRQIPRPGP